MEIIIAAIIVLLVITVFILGYRPMTLTRKPGMEGLEDKELDKAYDRMSRWPQFKLLRKMVVRELHRYNPAGTILDIGCGPGYLITEIAKSFPKLHCIGMDISQEMTSLATANISTLGFGKRVEFRQGDIQAMPFNDNSVDFVVSTLSLHHWQQPPQALAEIHRILKPGGQFLIFDLRRDCHSFFYYLVRFAQRWVVPLPIRRANEPTGSILASYTANEAALMVSKTQFKKHKVKSGPAWLFIWGHKMETNY